MTLALVIVPIVALTSIDDFTGTLAAQNPHMLDLWTNRKGEPLTFIAWASLLGWGLAYFGQPHILARYKAIRSEAEVPRAATIAITWSLLVYTMAVIVGMAGAAYMPEPLADPEKVFMVLVEIIFNPLVAGVLLAAILAAIMSTVDSQLLVCSSALAEDIIDTWTKRDIHSATALKLGRIAVVVLAVLACLLALDPNSQVLKLVAYAWGGLGAAFGPAVLISLYWNRMTAAAALAGIFVGGTTVVVWAQFTGGWFDLYELFDEVNP
jgi:sodium/proline symporter